MIRPTRAWRTAVVLATASLALTACGGNNNSGSAGGGSSASSSSSASAPAKGDGTLTVGSYPLIKYGSFVDGGASAFNLATPISPRVTATIAFASPRRASVTAASHSACAWSS